MIPTSNNQSTKENPVPLPLYRPQIPRGLAWNLSQAFTLRGRHLTASGMAQSPLCFLHAEGDITSLRKTRDISSNTVSTQSPGFNLNVTMSLSLL